jgi:acetyl-CoA C-acetyltransferase
VSVPRGVRRYLTVGGLPDGMDRAPPRVAGVGLTHFGVHPERTGRDLFAEAAATAFEDAGVPRTDVDGVYYGNFMGELTEHQGHQAPLMAEAAGLTCPATRYENACASSGVAVREAVRTVRNGEADVLLVGGAERMNNVGTAGSTEGLAVAADDLFEVRAGVTFPGAYALMARAYFDEFGGSREDLAHIAVKNHDNALDNEFAQYQRAIDLETALEAPPIAEPLHLFDSCPITDGASAFLLVSEDYAAENDLDAGIAIAGTGQGGDHLALQDRADLAFTPATEAAAGEAFADAGIERDAVAFAEVHDCFTIAEVLALEGLGFYDRGAAIDAARAGETTRDGDLPVNLSGGLKAKGHPVGATGAAQVVEATRLLRGDHPNSDAVDGDVGVTHNAGGTVASAVVHVLEVDA